MKKVLFANILVLLLLLAYVELTLLAFGYQPGITEKDKNFKRVNKLVELDGYELDSLGIMKVSDNARNTVSGYISKGKLGFKYLELYQLRKNHHHPTPYSLGRDFLMVKKGRIRNIFSDFIKKIKSKEELTRVDSAYINYVNNPINTEGFRSIEFKNYSTDKLKVLLLGDSFTWGHTTGNKTDSFADLLATKDYVVYNSGIVGADLPQYSAIAKKYIRRIRPDYVVVNLYLTNDISRYDRPLLPGVPIYYPTNAGSLYSCPHGIYFTSPESIYNHILDVVSIPQNSAFNKVMSKTRITTQIWSRLARMNLISNKQSETISDYWSSIKKFEVGYSVNKKHLDSIQRVCDEYSADLFVVIIPDHHNTNPNNIDDLLVKFPFHKMNNLKYSDYSGKTGHFNESGHEKYADFIDSLLTMRNNNPLKHACK